MNLKKVLLGFIVLMSAGCSSIEAEKPVTYYVLDTRPLPLIEKNVQRSVVVENIVLPDYLNQPNLVLRDSSQKLHVAFYHSWADDLSSSIRRVIVSQLNAQDKNTHYTVDCNQCDRLSITLDHFYPTTQGEVLLAGEYQYSADNQQLLRQNFLVSVELTEDGYEHAVKKMQLALSQLVLKVSQSIKTIKPEAITTKQLVE